MPNTRAQAEACRSRLKACDMRYLWPRRAAQADGVRGLWRGVLPGYAKIFPSIFISYFVYER